MPIIPESLRPPERSLILDQTRLKVQPIIQTNIEQPQVKEKSQSEQINDLIKQEEKRADDLYNRELELMASPSHSNYDIQDLRASRNEAIQRANYLSNSLVYADKGYTLDSVLQYAYAGANASQQSYLVRVAAELNPKNPQPYIEPEQKVTNIKYIYPLKETTTTKELPANKISIISQQQIKNKMTSDEFMTNFAQATPTFKNPVFNSNLPYKIRGTVLNMQPKAPITNIFGLSKEQMQEQASTFTSLKGKEKSNYMIESSKPYQTFLKYSEPIRLTAMGMSGLFSEPLSKVYEPVLGFFRPTGEGLTSKAERGAVMAGEVVALESNPITSIPTTVYFGSSYVKSLAENPLGTWLNTGEYIVNEPFEFIGGIVGGGFSKGLKESITEKAKISSALDESKIKIKEKGYLKENDLNVLKLEEGQKAELVKSLNEGKAIRLYETKVEPAKGYEKYTPNIKGLFVEIINDNGDIINRQSIGKIKAEYKGKVLDFQNAGKALLKIDEEAGGIIGIGDVLQKQVKKPVLNPVTGKIETTKGNTIFSRFYEESKIKNYEENAKRRLVSSSSYSELLNQEKLKPNANKQLLEGYGKIGTFEVYPTNELKGTGKPYLNTENLEIQLKTSEGSKGIIAEKGGKGFAMGLRERKFRTFGIGESERIKPKAKKIVPNTKFNIFNEESFGKTKYKQPKVETGNPQIFADLIEPDYVRGGEVGLKKEGKYYGQQFKVPFGEQATFEVIKELPSEFSRGSFARGFIEGSFSGTNLVNSNKIDLSSQNLEAFKISTPSANTQSNNLIVKGLEINNQKTGTSEKEREKQSNADNTIYKFETALVQKPQEIQREMQANITALKLITTQGNKPAPPSYPITDFTFPGEENPKERIPRKEKKKKVVGSLFIPVIKRKGKFIEASQPTSFNEAFGIGVRNVKKTLAASFGIIEKSTGRLVNINPPTSEFRFSKKSNNILVQRRGFRLGSIQERQEIKRARFRL